MAPVVLISALTALAPTGVTPPTADGAVLAADAQWAALAACPRLMTDRGARGTAVAVGHQDGSTYLLTARHVVTDQISSVTFDFFYRPGQRHGVWKPPTTVAAKVLDSADADFLLLKIADAKKEVTTLKLAPPGKRPKAFPFEAVSIGCADGQPPTCRAETIRAKVFARDGMNTAFFWESAQPPKPGRSGGPLLSKDGTLIGLCAAARGDTGYYTHADEILAVLKEKGFGWLWE